MAMPETVEFLFRVTSPSIEYGLRKLTKAAGQLDAMWEATCEAVCLAPAQFAGREAAVRIYSADDLGMALTDDRQVRSLGRVFANSKTIEAVLHLPQADCWGVVGAVRAGSVEYVTTFSPPLYRSAAEIEAFVFEGPLSALAQASSGQGSEGS